MKRSVLILTEDTVFGRMLELEFRMHRLDTRLCGAWGSEHNADVILLDLDSVPTPAEGVSGCIIGFTRRFSISEMDRERRCSMILHRPFEMRLLREEVLALVDADGERGTREEPKRRRELRLDGTRLFCGEACISLSPKEAAVMSCLLSGRGRVVPREEIGACIGETETNKVDVYICYLRRKLKKLTDQPLIQTVRKRGYQVG